MKDTTKTGHLSLAEHRHNKKRVLFAVNGPKPAVLVDSVAALDRIKHDQVPPFLRFPSSPCGLFSRAVDLAEKHDFPQIEALLVRHTGQLLQKGDPLQAVEVFRMAGKATDAALLLAKLAEDAGEVRVLHASHGCHYSSIIFNVPKKRQKTLSYEVDAPRLSAINEGRPQWHMLFLNKTDRCSADEETIRFAHVWVMQVRRLPWMKPVGNYIITPEFVRTARGWATPPYIVPRGWIVWNPYDGNYVQAEGELIP